MDGQVTFDGYVGSDEGGSYSGTTKGNESKKKTESQKKKETEDVVYNDMGKPMSTGRADPDHSIEMTTLPILGFLKYINAGKYIKGVFGFGTKAAKGGGAEGAVWAQKTFSGTFSAGGKFAGQTVEGVAGGLRSGAISAADVPIDVIVRNGQTFILNKRSSAALMQGGIPRSAWNVVNRTGASSFEGRLTNQLLKNGIPGGANTIKSGSTILTH